MQAILDQTNVWKNVLGVVEKRLNKNIFDSWFLPIKFEGCDETKQQLSLRAGTVTKEWVCSYYSELIEQSMRELDLPAYTIDWQIEETESEKDVFADEELLFETKTEAAAAGASAGARSTETVNQQSYTKNTPTHFVDIEPIENSLNPKYTFEKFVVGSCNQFAHAAALGAAEAPGTTYNPLFMYGGVGLGKTHLMHAIGHSIKERNRHLRVAYITS